MIAAVLRSVTLQPSFLVVKLFLLSHFSDRLGYMTSNLSLFAPILTELVIRPLVDSFF